MRPAGIQTNVPTQIIRAIRAHPAERIIDVAENRVGKSRSPVSYPGHLPAIDELRRDPVQRRRRNQTRTRQVEYTRHAIIRRTGIELRVERVGLAIRAVGAEIVSHARVGIVRQKGNPVTEPLFRIQPERVVMRVVVRRKQTYAPKLWIQAALLS